MRVQDKDIQPVVADDSFEQIGSTLKQARRAQGLKISDVSQQLRISVDYLSKLEMGAFDQLPAPAYVTGFLRSYGQCVALDPTTLVARYNDLTTKAATMPTYKIPVGCTPATAIGASHCFNAGCLCWHCLRRLVLGKWRRCE